MRVLSKIIRYIEPLKGAGHMAGDRGLYLHNLRFTSIHIMRICIQYTCMLYEKGVMHNGVLSVAGLCLFLSMFCAFCFWTPLHML